MPEEQQKRASAWGGFDTFNEKSLKFVRPKDLKKVSPATLLSE